MLSSSTQGPIVLRLFPLFLQKHCILATLLNHPILIAFPSSIEQYRVRSKFSIVQALPRALAVHSLFILPGA